MLANNESAVFTRDFLKEHPTSAGELAPGHPLLMGLCDLGIDSSVRYHSIIADLRDPPGPGATDGIVPYSSSHREWRRLRVARPWSAHLFRSSRRDPGGPAHPHGTGRNRPDFSDRSRWYCP